MAKKLISIRVDPEFHDVLKRYSLLHNVSITDILISSAKGFIENIDIENKDIDKTVEDENLSLDSNIKKLQMEVIDDLTDLL